MRIVYGLLAAACSAALIFVLNTKAILPAPLGKLLSPQHGIWQNAEAANKDFSANLQFPSVKGEVTAYLDDRLVPHVFAANEEDLYFVQGYLHAQFRLWQMELQTHAAAGRAAEIIGAKALHHDRQFRRMGMGYAAELALLEMEKDPLTKMACDAYTAGVNAWISSLSQSQLPLEYKLIGYQPEPWSNLKTMLFLKYMSYDLAGFDEDFEMTNARNFFSKADFDLLYPAVQDSLSPIIPAPYQAPTVLPKQPALADSLYFSPKPLQAIAGLQHKPDKNNGSNNWAVAGTKTASGVPILCSDPHLGLNLPSLWYEVQLSCGNFNAYGVSFPGAPGVIIGFNDSCAFGFTNGGRDVKEYYRIRFKDASRNEYWFNNEWKKTNWRVEKFAIKDSTTFVDSVAYTVFGPVIYDGHFNNEKANNGDCYALRWTAHDPSNELKIFMMLDRTKNYEDYTQAALNLHTPGQNCVFAAKNGDIALRTQGKWPAKWKGQGDFVMPGEDSSYMWQSFIPMSEVPLQYRPQRGFVSSANQKPADSTYPYYLGRNYPPYRGLVLNKKLDTMQGITAGHMMQLQTSNYNIFAEQARPIALKYINTALLSPAEARYFADMANWNLQSNVEETGPTIFKLWWDSLETVVYSDEFKNAPASTLWPYESSLLDGLLRDSTYKFIDDTNTPNKETLADAATQAFKKACMQLQKLATENKLAWGRFKATRVMHLAKLEPLSRLNLPIGGGSHILNATRDTHGPSWRMVVQLSNQTEAYGVYPGGQSGNPGSRYYDSFVDKWVAGDYYNLWVMKADETSSNKIKYKISFGKR
jgi:penicillin G amidase